MGKKKEIPKKWQQEVIKTNGLNVLTWTVVNELPNSLIVRHRITGEFKVIGKEAAKV